MSTVLAYIENNPQETQRIIGLKYEQLQQLIIQAQAVHNQKQASVESNKIRIITKEDASQNYPDRSKFF